MRMDVLGSCRYTMFSFGACVKRLPPSNTLQKARAASAASGQDEVDELNRQKRLEGTAVTPASFVEWAVRACV